MGVQSAQLMYFFNLKCPERRTRISHHWPVLSFRYEDFLCTIFECHWGCCLFYILVLVCPEITGQSNGAITVVSWQEAPGFESTGCCLSVWSLHVLAPSVLVGVFPLCSVFFPKSKHMQVRWNICGCTSVCMLNLLNQSIHPHLVQILCLCIHFMKATVSSSIQTDLMFLSDLFFFSRL